MLQLNQRVHGVYCGLPIVGVICVRRPLTVRTDGAIEYDVKLDQPIEVYSLTRDRVYVYARHDGSSSSYTKHSDWLMPV